MTHLTSTAKPGLVFSAGEPTQKTNIPTAKIGWLHTVADEPGTKFDIIIKDALGRVKFERKNFGSENEKAGELVNLPTLLGEELEVSVENIKGGKSVQLFLN